MKCFAVRPTTPHEFPLFKEQRATLMSKVENKIDIPLIESSLFVTNC